MKFTTPQGHDFFHLGFFTGPDLYDETGAHRGWLAALGVFFLLLGVLGLCWVTLTTLLSVLFFGALAVVGGAAQIAQSFTSHGWRNILPGLLFGALYLFAGAIIYFNPVAASMTLTFFLAAALMALGFVRMAFSVEHQANRFWIWSVVSGILSVMLGFLIMAQWPITALWVIGLFVSLELIFHGAAACTMALVRERSAD